MKSSCFIFLYISRYLAFSVICITHTSKILVISVSTRIWFAKKVVSNIPIWSSEITFIMSRHVRLNTLCNYIWEILDGTNQKPRKSTTKVPPTASGPFCSLCVYPHASLSSEFILNVLLPYESIFAFKKSSSVWTDTVGVGNPIHSRAHLKKEKQVANMFQWDKKGKGRRDRAAVATFLAIRWRWGLCWDCSVYTSDSNRLRIF